jgi:hypothetical protein
VFYQGTVQHIVVSAGYDDIGIGRGGQTQIPQISIKICQCGIKLL